VTLAHAFEFGLSSTALEPDQFWHWCRYDYTWNWQQDLVSILREHSHGDALEHYSPESLAFYNSLPPRKPIMSIAAAFRIISRASHGRPTAMSLAFFAMRGGHTNMQGIARGVISKRDWGFYFVNAERREAEIVCEPRIVGWDPLSNEQLDEIIRRRAAPKAKGLAA
jgi:hypothetical protein